MELKEWGVGKREREEHWKDDDRFGRRIREIYFGRDANFAPAKFSGRVSAAEVAVAAVLARI